MTKKAEKTIDILRAEQTMYEVLYRSESDKEEKARMKEVYKGLEYAIHACIVVERFRYLVEESGNKDAPGRKKYTTVSLESIEELMK